MSMTNIKTNVLSVNAQSAKQVNIGSSNLGFLESLSTGMKIHKAADLPSDVNIPPMSSNPDSPDFCSPCAELDEDGYIVFGFGLDKPYKYTGGSITINDKDIPQSYALNPEYWKAINVYNKNGDTTATEIVPSDQYMNTGLRVFIQGEPINIGQFFYYNPSDSKCYVYKSGDTDRDHIDRILGVCVLEAIDNKFFGLTHGLVNFDGAEYNIGKNYYIGNTGYWTNNILRLNSENKVENVRVPIGRPIDKHTMYLDIREAVILTEENENGGGS